MPRNALAHTLLCLASLCLLAMSLQTQAQTQVIEINQGNDQQARIAIIPFAGKASENLAQIAGKDLASTGQFEQLDDKDFLSLPRPGDTPMFRDWRMLGADYLLMGALQESATGFALSYELYDIQTQRQLLSRKLPLRTQQLRLGGHKVADDVYQAVTGLKGAFASTRLAYVLKAQNSTDNKKQGQKFSLIISDSDGQNAQTLISSKQPIVTPTWSHNVKLLAYTSYENKKPEIIVHPLSGNRKNLGSGWAPSFSPDGTTLAFIAPDARTGKAKLFLYNLAGNQRQQLTQGYSVDGEPAFSETGNEIYFSSNRGGKTQIYRLNISTKAITRATRTGHYNARPSLSRDNKSLVFIHQPARGQGFYLASQDLATDDMRILHKGFDSDSPSVAPNGAFIVFAEAGQLKRASVDTGQVDTLIGKTAGRSIREPTWSGYLR